MRHHGETCQKVPGFIFNKSTLAQLLPRVSLKIGHMSPGPMAMSCCHFICMAPYLGQDPHLLHCSAFCPAVTTDDNEDMLLLMSGDGIRDKRHPVAYSRSASQSPPHKALRSHDGASPHTGVRSLSHSAIEFTQLPACSSLTSIAAADSAALSCDST